MGRGDGVSVDKIIGPDLDQTKECVLMDLLPMDGLITTILDGLKKRIIHIEDRFINGY